MGRGESDSAYAVEIVGAGRLVRWPGGTGRGEEDGGRRAAHAVGAGPERATTERNTTLNARTHSSTSALLSYRPRRDARRWRASGAALLLMAGLTAGGFGALTLRPRQADAQALRSLESVPGAGITVIGEGVIRARPDVITLRLGVEANAQTAPAALTQVRASSERVIQKLRELGVSDADLQTTGLNVFRIQDGPVGPMGSTGAPGAGATPVTYRGWAGVSATVADVNKAGALLEGAMQAGATSLENMQFGLRDDAALRRQAVAAAINDARPQAEAAASAAGLKLGAVRAVSELAGTGPLRVKGGGAAEGIAPGETNVSVVVQITYDVAP